MRGPQPSPRSRPPVRRRQFGFIQFQTETLPNRRLTQCAGPPAETIGVTVTPIVAHRIRLSARSLLQAAENGGAGLRHGGLDRLAPWHNRPAAFFDICRLFPGAGLLQSREGVGGVGAALELVDARSAISPRPQRYSRCFPPTSSPCFQASPRPNRSRWRESRRRRRRRLVGSYRRRGPVFALSGDQ